MTKNTYVKIIASPEFSRMKLGGLVGRQGLPWKTCPVKTEKITVV